jgi:rhodanese-related sulfurtransferase
MMRTISREEVKRKLAQDGNVAVVEALPKDSYAEFHLPGAINVPFGDRFAKDIQAAIPDKNRTIIVYCMNAECDASPKAVKRMEKLGYTNVFDYEAGKVDWKEAGLPVEP